MVTEILDTEGHSSATRVNKDGLIESVAANVPRLDYPIVDGVVQDCPVLLLGRSRTNLALYSEQFDNSYWGKSSNLSIPANYAVSPDGAQNADRWVSTGGSFPQMTRTISGLTIGQTYTASLYVKSDGTSQIEQRLHFTGFAGTLFTPTDEWVRITNTFTATSTSHVFVLFTNSGSAPASSYLIWGAQVEQGGYPTSYIPTTSSTVTRSADVCDGAGTSAEFNDSEGVLFAYVQLLNDADTSNRYISLSDGTTTNSVLFQYTGSATSTDGHLYVYNAGASTERISSIFTDLSEPHKIALRYGNTKGEYQVYFNGFSQAIRTQFTAVPMSGLNQLQIDYPISTFAFNGKVKQILTFKSGLTSDELEKLTSWDSFNDMAKSQLYTIE